MFIRKIGVEAVSLLVLVLISVVSCSADSVKFAAKANGVGITSETLDTALNNFVESQKMMGATVKEEDKDTLRKDILEELISAELLYQESKAAGLGDLSGEVDTQLEALKNGFDSADEFNKILEDRGITENDLRDDIEKGIYIKTFLERDVYKDIVINEEEKQAEYEKNKESLDVPEQVKASHILFRFEPDTSDEEKEALKTKMEDLREKALSGEDFAELAKEHSEDGTAPMGGDLGYFGRNAMIQPFEDVAFGMNPGDISDVVETQFGYHIIKVVDKQNARTLGYEEVESAIEEYLTNQRRMEQLNKFVDGLREKATIERF